MVDISSFPRGTGTFPSMFKISSVAPIFKTGDKTDVNNYRPIAIQNHIAKIFELLVLKSIQPLVNFILVDEQYGFRPSRSATTNLIVFEISYRRPLKTELRRTLFLQTFPKRSIV